MGRQARRAAVKSGNGSGAGERGKANVRGVNGEL